MQTKPAVEQNKKIVICCVLWTVSNRVMSACNNGSLSHIHPLNWHWTHVHLLIDWFIYLLILTLIINYQHGVTLLLAWLGSMTRGMLLIFQWFISSSYSNNIQHRTYSVRRYCIMKRYIQRSVTWPEICFVTVNSVTFFQWLFLKKLFNLAAPV